MAPGPSVRLAANRSPRCASAISRAMARPRPVPSALVVKNGSNRWPSASGARPGPVSATTARTVWRAGSLRVIKWRVPPFDMAWMALVVRLRKSWSSACGAIAIQAMSKGGTLHLMTRSDPARQAVLAVVADTGPGLPPEALGHLFEPFFTTKAEGTGLGLAIAREIALAHRGDLFAANRTDGPGAIFTLTLPAASTLTHGELR